MTRTHPISIAAALAAAVLLSACASPPPPPAGITNDELSQALKEAAKNAVEVRVRLSNMQTLPLTEGSAPSTQPIPPEALAQATARIDIDYVGPVANATKLISRILGWDITINGKSRADVIVSLRHTAQDAVTILQDIGAQCGHRCDVHVELVEAGKSSIVLTYRD